VVVPRTQGFQDTVSHEVDGFFFTPGNATDARKYLQLLKDDVHLRLEMGKAGRKAIKEQEIQFVVADLLTWYHRGIKNRQGKSSIRILGCYLLMAFFAPTTIFMFFVYDILVS
jgi:hypothetical protein